MAGRRTVWLSVGSAALLLGSCTNPLCGCSWTSEAIIFGSVTDAADGAPVAGTQLEFDVYNGGQACVLDSIRLDIALPAAPGAP